VLATHTQRFLVRFDECGPDAAARSSTLLRYVVETAFAHSAEAGYPLSWYYSNGLFWVVRRAHLDLVRAVPYPEGLEVTTRVVGARRFWARRVNTVRGGDGCAIGTVTMDWVLTDRHGHPARMPAHMAAAFPVLPGGPDRAGPEVGVPPAGARESAHEIRPHQTDPRGHMNNAAYLDLFDDVLVVLGVDPQERPAQYELEFLKPARAPAVLKFATWITASGVNAVARLQDGSVAWRGHQCRGVPGDTAPRPDGAT